MQQKLKRATAGERHGDGLGASRRGDNFLRLHQRGDRGACMPPAEVPYSAGAECYCRVAVSTFAFHSGTIPLEVLCCVLNHSPDIPPLSPFTTSLACRLAQPGASAPAQWYIRSKCRQRATLQVIFWEAQALCT